MPGIFGAFGAVFGVVGLALAAGGLALAAFLLYRVVLRRRTLEAGLTAEAECLETYVTSEAAYDEDRDRYTRTMRHVILGFRTEDGRDVRIRDRSGAPRVVGDFVTVRYLPERPQDAAVAGRPTGIFAVGVGLGLFFCLVTVGVGVLFAVFGFAFGTVAEVVPTHGFPSGFSSPGWPSDQPGPGFPSVVPVVPGPNGVPTPVWPSGF
ncbi:DUF3592 domain-containing protein [Kitasatospora sp. NPDC002227]|uniref:DUF3592 domain-containing protein n=1 Tax=Kitasatospora sp. NPDC002227 TaxID=3154773 RepID=UPI00331D3E4E